MTGASNSTSPGWHGTTILAVRKNHKLVMLSDGQVSMGQTVMKGNARKVRRLADGAILAGFAGATADAFTLFERLETKLERHNGQLSRAAVELAKDWRTEKYLQKLEALLIVADKEVTLVLTGAGDVLEPEYNVVAVGSGGNYALSAAARSTTTKKTPKPSAARRCRSPRTFVSTPMRTSRSKPSTSDRTSTRHDRTYTPRNRR